MTEVQILELIKTCGSTECGAIHGYKKHEQTQKETAKKIYNAMQVKRALGDINLVKQSETEVCGDCGGKQFVFNRRLKKNICLNCWEKQIGN